MSKEFRKESSGCTTNKPTPTLCFPKKINKYVKEPACETRDLCDFDKSLLKEPDAEIIVRDDRRKEYKITNARTEYICNENNSSYDIDDEGNPIKGKFPAKGVVEAGTISQSTFDYAEVENVKHEVAVAALQLAKANSQCRFYNYKTEYVCPTWFMKAERSQQGGTTTVTKTFSETAQEGYDEYQDANTNDNGVLKAREIEYLLPYPSIEEGKDFSIQSVLDEASHEQEVVAGNIPSTGTIQDFMNCQGNELARSMSACTYGNVAGTGKCKRVDGTDDTESIAEDATLEANSFIEQADQTTLTKDCNKGDEATYENTDPDGYTPEQRAISDVWDEADIYLQANVQCIYGNDRYTAVCPSSVAIAETGNFTRVWETGFINADANQVYVVSAENPVVAGNAYDTLVPPNGTTPVLEEGGYLISDSSRNLRMVKITESEYLSREESSTDGSYRSYVQSTRPGDTNTDTVVDSYTVGNVVYYRCVKGTKPETGGTISFSGGISLPIETEISYKDSNSNYYFVYRGTGTVASYEQEVRTIVMVNEKNSITVDENSFTESFDSSLTDAQRAVIKERVNQQAYTQAWGTIGNPPSGTITTILEWNHGVSPLIEYKGSEALAVKWTNGYGYTYSAFKFYDKDGAMVYQTQGSSSEFTIQCPADKNAVGYEIVVSTGMDNNPLEDGVVVVDSVLGITLNLSEVNIQKTEPVAPVYFDGADVRNFSECYFKNEASKEYCKIADIDYRTVNSFNVKPTTGEVVRWPATFIKASGASLDPVNWKNNGSPIPNGATTYTPDDKYINLAYGEFSESVLQYEGKNIYLGQRDVNNEASLYAQTQTMCAWGNSALGMTNCSKIPSKACDGGYANGDDPVVESVSENSFVSYISKKEADDQAKAFQEATAVCICADWVGGGGGGTTVSSSVSGGCGSCSSCTVFY